ncbi:MAG: PLP-dependent aminotransferase family protein [Anaerolineae bacterium]|nr:PLP-dependent aminotransferase family protein [Anaerolineae bacterium]NUQ04154.1 PLP-dependent aminotransferase family protein [Anaerolineae bacterium]
MTWDKLFAKRTAQMKRSTVREILKLTSQPDVISFAGGLPAPELFPVERIQQAAELALTERGREALQYSTSEGMPELRGWIADRLSTETLKVEPQNILIVSGSQQAQDLVGKILFDEGDAVIVENPTYVGMLTAWRPYLLDFAAVPTDHDGMQTDALEALLEKRAFKAAYSIPNFQNPQGVTLSYERRIKLAALLARYDLPLYEDDPYGALRYSGAALPSVQQVEAVVRKTSALDDCTTMYAGTFSKTLTPGLRVGWIAAAFPVIDKLVQAKQAADLHTSTLNQFIVYEAVRDGDFLDEHIARLREVYRQRRDLMLRTMEECFPAEVTWTRPDGGLFLLVTMPEGMDATEILKLALEQKVAFVPAESFHIGEMGRNTFRLNFSNARPEMIEAGIRRLGALLKEAVRVAL